MIVRMIDAARVSHAVWATSSISIPRPTSQIRCRIPLQKWNHSAQSEAVKTSTPNHEVSNPSTVTKYSGEVAAARNHHTTRMAPNVIRSDLRCVSACLEHDESRYGKQASNRFETCGVLCDHTNISCDHKANLIRPEVIARLPFR